VPLVEALDFGGTHIFLKHKARQLQIRHVKGYHVYGVNLVQRSSYGKYRVV